MSTAWMRKSLERQLSFHGEDVALQRAGAASAVAGSPIGLLLALTHSSSSSSFSVRARIVGASPSDVTGNVQQLGRKAIVSAADVEAAGFPLPFRPKQDRLIWNGKTLVITAVDDATQRIQGTLIAFELELSGA